MPISFMHRIGEFEFQFDLKKKHELLWGRKTDVYEIRLRRSQCVIKEIYGAPELDDESILLQKARYALDTMNGYLETKQIARLMQAAEKNSQYN